LPRRSHPETAIDGFILVQTDASDQLLGIRFESQRPIPALATLHFREGNITAESQRAVRRIGPGNGFREVPDNIPMRKNVLDLLNIRHLERAEDQPEGGQNRKHVWILSACILRWKIRAQKTGCLFEQPDAKGTIATRK
jgi:hypothetical protein